MSDYSTEASVTVNAIQGSMTGITALETGLVSINNQVQDIGRAITAQGNIMDTMIASVGVIAATGAVKAAEAFGNVEQSMKIVQMVSQQTSADIQYLTQQANQFSTQYRTDIDQITEGLQTLGRAGLNSASEQSEVLENGLQTAKLEGRELNSVLEELIQNTALLGGDLKSNNFGEQTDYINDLLISTSMSAPIDTHDVSETLKYSGGMLAAAGGDINTAEGKRLIEDYMGSVAAFAQKGVTGSIAGTALRAFFNKPATQDSSVLEGLSQLHLRPEYLWEDGGERMKPVSDQIGIIQSQMDKLNISTMDQMQIWSKIVGGKMGQQMMKLKSNDIKDLTKDIQNSASAEDLATKSMQTYESTVKEAQETAALAFRNFGEKVAKWLAPIVKIGTLILKIFAHPVGSYALFTGFLAILSKTVSIGIRYIRTFANDLKATLAGVNMLSNNIADKSAQANVSAAATASTAAAAQKVRETNKQQAQQKETVNRAAIERTAMLEKAKAVEIKSEIDSNVNALHNNIQYKIDETAANIKTKISAAIKSSTNDLTYLAYNDKGKLKQDKGFDRGVNFSGVEPGTVVEPPIRTSTGFTAYRDSMTTSAEQYIATKMLDEEKEFEKGLAEIQQKKQRNIALNKIYSSPLQEQETIGFLEERMEKENEALNNHLKNIRKHENIAKLALDDIIMRDNNIARAAAFNHSDFVYDPINEKRAKFRERTNKILSDNFILDREEMLDKDEWALISSGSVASKNTGHNDGKKTTGSEYSRNFTTAIPLFRRSDPTTEEQDFIIDYQALVKQNAEAIAKLPEKVQRHFAGMMVAIANDNQNSASAHKGHITKWANKQNPETLAEMDALKHSLLIEDAIWKNEARSLAYNRAVKYIDDAQGGVEGFKLMFATEQAVLPTKKDSVAITQEEIDYREKGIAKRNKDLKTLFTNLNESDKQISKLATLGYSSTGLSDLAASGFDAFGRPTTPTHARIRNKPPKFMDFPEVSVSDTGFINTPTMGNQISIKQLRKGIEEYNRFLLGVSDIGFINTPAKGNQISIKQFEENIDAYNESLRRGIERLQYADPISRGAKAQRAYLKDKYQDKFSLSDRLFKQNTIPMTDVFIRKQIQGLTLVNAAANEFVQTAKEAAALSKAQRKGKYYNEHPERIGRKDSVITDSERPFSRAAMTKNRQSTEDFVREEEKKRKTHYNYLTEARNNVVADNQRAQAALKKLGYEKEITRELREQDRILNAQEAKERRPGKQTKNGILNSIFGSNKDKDSTNNQFKDMAQQIEERRKERENFMNRLPKGYSDSQKETRWNNRDLFKSDSVGTKIVDWAKNSLGLGSDGGLSGGFKGLGKSLKSAGSSLISFVAEGLNPVTMAMVGLTFVIDQINAAHENYIKELGDIQKNLDDAITQRNDAESQIKDEYANLVPDATEDDKQAYLDNIYSKIDESYKNPLEFLDQLGTISVKPPEYEEDEEEVGVLHQIKEEEQSSGDKIAENTKALIYASVEIQSRLNVLANKMDDPIWGVNGIMGNLADFKDSISRPMSTENSAETGEVNIPSKLADENYPGNNEMAGAMSTWMPNTKGTQYDYTTFGNLSDEYQDKYLSYRLEQLFPKSGANTYKLTTDAARAQLKAATKQLSMLSSGQANALGISMKQDKKTYQKIGKEIAKMEKGNKKSASRIENYVRSIQRTTGHNLNRQTILAAASMQQLQDMKEVAQSTISPMLMEQVKLGVQSVALGGRTASSNYSISDTSATTAANAQLIAAFLADQALHEGAHAAFEEYSAKGLTQATSTEGFLQEIGDGAEDTVKSDTSKALLAEKRAAVLSGVMSPTLRFQHPDWTDAQVQAESMKRINQHFNGMGESFSQVADYAKKSLSNVLDDYVYDAYMNSDVGADDTSGSSGGSGSGGGGSGSGSSGDKSGTKKDRVDLVLCSKKQIPKLDVNLFKKAPQFTILNKNFRLRDIKISTKDKPKAVLDSIKNAIIDTQQRMDPKIIQDEDAEYNPAEATDGKSLPAGSTNTSTK